MIITLDHVTDELIQVSIALALVGAKLENRPTADSILRVLPQFERYRIAAVVSNMGKWLTISASSREIEWSVSPKPLSVSNK